MLCRLMICLFVLLQATPGRGDAPAPNRQRGGAAGANGGQVQIIVRGEYRYIESNGLPDHKPGRFPNRGNPNTIRAQHYTYRVPLHPVAAGTVTPVRMHAFGVAVNGVPFDPGAAEFWNRDWNSGWQYEALSGKIDLGMDANNAHVQPSGAYHYHGVPTGLLKILAGAKQGMLLVGYAADGFPMYGPAGYSKPNDDQSELRQLQSSYRLKKGTRPNGPGGRYDGTFVQDWEYVAEAGDLDECNGRNGVTPEYPQGTYYYVLTVDYPFIPRAYRGTPDPSFFRKGPPPGGGPPGRGPPGPGRRGPPGGPPDGRPGGPPPGSRPPPS